MVEKNEWVDFKEIEWNDPKFNVFSVDTRDFHCGYRYETKQHKDFACLKKYPHFFLTEEELKTLLQKWFDESGGKAEWRMFSLTGFGDNWNLKYLRIWRTELGFVVCNSNNYAMKKEILSYPVAQEHLCTH